MLVSALPGWLIPAPAVFCRVVRFPCSRSLRPDALNCRLLRRLRPHSPYASPPRDCNIAKQADYPVLATWTDADKAAALARVPDLLGRALLWKLLSKDPESRPADMREVLRHPFFAGGYGGDDLTALLQQRRSGGGGEVEKKGALKVFFWCANPDNV